MKKYVLTTHGQQKLHKPLIKTNVRKFSIFYKGIDIYNSLPSDLKKIQCKSTFKRKRKELIGQDGWTFTRINKLIGRVIQA